MEDQSADNKGSTTEASMYPPPHYSPYHFYPPPVTTSNSDPQSPQLYPLPPPDGSTLSPNVYQQQWPPLEAHSWYGFPTLPVHHPYYFPPLPPYMMPQFSYQSYPNSWSQQPHHPSPHVPQDPQASTPEEAVTGGPSNSVVLGSEQSGVDVILAASTVVYAEEHVTTMSAINHCESAYPPPHTEIGLDVSLAANPVVLVVENVTTTSASNHCEPPYPPRHHEGGVDVSSATTPILHAEDNVTTTSASNHCDPPYPPPHNEGGVDVSMAATPVVPAEENVTTTFASNQCELPYPPPHNTAGLVKSQEPQGPAVGALINLATLIVQHFAAAQEAIKAQADLSLASTPSKPIRGTGAPLSGDSNNQVPVENPNSLTATGGIHFQSGNFDVGAQCTYSQTLYPPLPAYYPPPYYGSPWASQHAPPSTPKPLSLLEETTLNASYDYASPYHPCGQPLYTPPPPYYHSRYHGSPWSGPLAPPPTLSKPTSPTEEVPCYSGYDYWNSQSLNGYPHYVSSTPFVHPHYYGSPWERPQPHAPPSWPYTSPYASRQCPTCSSWYNPSQTQQQPEQNQQLPESPAPSPPELYPNAKFPYTEYFKDLIWRFSEFQNLNHVDATAGTEEGEDEEAGENITWEKGNILEGLDDDEDEGDEEPQYAMTDEWAEFFVKSEARRREKRRQAKKQAKAARKAAKTVEEGPVESSDAVALDDVIKCLESTTVNVNDEVEDPL